MAKTKPQEKNETEKRSKGILVRVLPSVYDECMKYNLNIPLIMRRGLAAELELHKAGLNNQEKRMLWKDYDDKTMSFIEDRGMEQSNDGCGVINEDMYKDIISTNPEKFVGKKYKQPFTTGGGK